MKTGVARPFGAQLRALRETAGFTQEELATIAGLSVHAVSALEAGNAYAAGRSASIDALMQDLDSVS